MFCRMLTSQPPKRKIPKTPSTTNGTNLKQHKLISLNKAPAHLSATESHYKVTTVQNKP